MNHEQPPSDTQHQNIESNPPRPAWISEALADWNKAKEAVSIDPQAGEIPVHLNNELLFFPEQIAWWGFRLAEAVREEQMAAMGADDCYAAAIEKAKAMLGPAKRGEVSQASYDRAARLDQEWRKAELARIHAEAKCGRLKSVMQGLQAKREALMSLGANLRAEIQADPTLRDKARNQG